jgi:hypothetical protein
MEAGACCEFGGRNSYRGSASEAREVVAEFAPGKGAAGVKRAVLRRSGGYRGTESCGGLVESWRRGGRCERGGGSASDGQNSSASRRAEARFPRPTLPRVRLRDGAADPQDDCST